MRTVILHIGMHKTGTTSIQNSLKNYDDADTFYANLSHPNHSIPFYTCFSKEYQSYHIWIRQGLSRREIQSNRENLTREIVSVLERSDRRRVIFSGEDISILSDDEAQELIDFLYSYADDIQVVAYYRDPIGFAVSDFQQWIKDGSTDISVSRPQYRFRFEKFIRAVGRGNVTLRDYDSIECDVVEDFMNLLNLDYKATAGLQFSDNPALPDEAIKVLYCFNKTNPCIIGDKELTRAHAQLVRIFRHMFADSGRFPRGYFSEAIDESDVQWLEELTGNELQTEKRLKGDHHSGDIESYLLSVAPSSMEKLSALLEENRVPSAVFDTVYKVVNRIFYMCLTTHFDLERGAVISRNVRDEEAEGLRDVALTYEKQEVLSKDKALLVMKVARKGRPNGPFINDKIREWESES